MGRSSKGRVRDHAPSRVLVDWCARVPACLVIPLCIHKKRVVSGNSSRQQQLRGGLPGKRRGVRLPSRLSVYSDSNGLFRPHVLTVTTPEKRWKFSHGAAAGVDVVQLAVPGEAGAVALAPSRRHSRLATLCEAENVGDSVNVWTPPVICEIWLYV